MISKFSWRHTGRIWRRLVFLLLISIFLVPSGVSQQLSETQIMGAYIYNFIRYIEWPNEGDIEEIVIGIYGDNDPLFEELSSAIDGSTIRNRIIRIVKTENLLSAGDSSLLVIPESESSNVDEIARSVRRTNTLLVTDRSSQHRSIMINFLHSEENQISFEVNRSNIIFERLSLSSDILLLGGTELDIAELYRELESSLFEMQASFEDQKAVIERQSVQVSTQEKAIQDNEIEILQFETRVRDLNVELANYDDQISLREVSVQTLQSQQEELNDALQQRQLELDQAHSNLEEERAELEENEAQILTLQQDISNNSRILQTQREEIGLLDENILRRDQDLLELGTTIETQQNVLFLFGLLLVLFVVFAFIAYWAYKKLKGMSKSLEDKNSELQKSKELVESSSAISQSTIENMSQGMLMVDEDQNILAFNDQFLKYMTIPKEAARSLNTTAELRQLARKYAGNENVDTGARSVAQGVDTSYELSIGDRMLDVRHKQLPTGGYLRTYTDLTELRQTEAFLGDVLDSTIDGIVTIDSAGIVQTFNNAAEKIFAYDRNEVIGSNVKMLMPDAVSVKHDEYLEAHVRTQKSKIIGRSREVLGKRKDGTTFPMDISISKAILGDRFIFTGIMRDITARKQFEKELLQSTMEAKAASAAKASFLASMSHEIRTPMNGVVGMVDLLSQTNMDVEQSQMLQTVHESGQSLLTIINDILDFSKIEAGKLELESIDSELIKLMEAAAETLAPNALKKKLKIITYIDPKLPSHLMADPVRVRQILINLGGNAIKFSEKGEVVIRADLESSGGKSVIVRFSVIDQGIGISTDALKGLFKEFSQADSTTTRQFGGTGLGLAISKRLAELMGGSISVQSEVGKGSTFYCEIPFVISKLKKAGDTVGDLSGLHVLLVSSNPTYELICRSYLEGQKAVVTHTVSLRNCVGIAGKLERANKPVHIVLIPDIDDNKKIISAQKSLSESGLSFCPPFVFGDDHRIKSRRIPKTKEFTAVRINPLKRDRLIASILIASGRENPEIYRNTNRFEIRGGRAPTPQEAVELGKLILLAEDNLTNQDVIRRQLTRLGYACEIANDGKEAYGMWRQNTYALLLTDCHMPEWDGFALTSAIRKDEESTSTRAPIVAITANALQGEAERCISAGMDDYMSKPVEMKTLRTILHKWIGDGGISELADLQGAQEKHNAPASANGGQKSVTSSRAVEKQVASAIDDRALKDQFGEDQAVFTEILVEFVDPSKAIIEELKTANLNSSGNDVKKAAHKLKSAARSVGANQLADLCVQLEVAGDEDNWKIINPGVEKIDKLMGAVVEYIDAL